MRCRTGNSRARTVESAVIRVDARCEHPDRLPLTMPGRDAPVAVTQGSFGQPTRLVGEIDFAGGSVAAGIGFSWGSGTLVFQGKTYNFKVSGFAVGDVGVASIDASGEVYNPTNIADFDGNYAAAGIGGTLAAGGTVIVMENPHGVVIQAHSTTAGLHLNLGPSGITFTIQP